MKSGYKTVRVVDLLPELKKEIPGIWWRENYMGMGILLGFDLRVDTSYSILPDYEFQVEGEDFKRSTEYLKMLGEELKLRAIRSLGLQPRLDAYDQQARKLESENREMQQKLVDYEKRVKNLEAEIAILQEAEENEDEE